MHGLSLEKRVAIQPRVVRIKARRKLFFFQKRFFGFFSKKNCLLAGLKLFASCGRLRLNSSIRYIPKLHAPPRMLIAHM
jgi:hypothetical protein